MAINTGLEIASITAVVPDHEASAIVVTAEAFIGEQRTSLEIAITTDLAPTMAIALLATTAKARAGRDGLDPALECLAADATLEGTEERLRLNLLFDKGAVLPVEMPALAGERLSERLGAVLNRESGAPS